MEVIQAVMIAYAVFTFVVVFVAVLCKGGGDLEGNPMSYVFWPIIAISGAIKIAVGMWK